MASDDLLKSGDVLAGKYQLLEPIGKGGMGVVFAAMHLGLEQRVAIKLLRPDNSHGPEAVNRFLAEARATARLRGVHVAKVLDVDRHGLDLPFFVMEFLQGENLQQLIATQGRRPQLEAVDMVLEACEAVAEAHRSGIVHRDLKPANLFLARDAYGEPTIKVLDFGISKLLEPTANGGVGLTDSRTMVGSPVYMSPEQMRSARDVDHRSDIWSLGTILFELLTGAPVWVGDNLADLCAQIARDRSPELTAVLPSIPPELSAIVERCLQKDPAQRYQQVSDLALALSRFGSKRGQLAVSRMLALLGQGGQPPIETTRAPSWSADGAKVTGASSIRATAATQATNVQRYLGGRELLVSAVLVAGIAMGVAGGWWVRSSRSPGAPREGSPSGRASEDATSAKGSTDNVALSPATSGRFVDERPSVAPASPASGEAVLVPATPRSKSGDGTPVTSRVEATASGIGAGNSSPAIREPTQTVVKRGHRTQGALSRPLPAAAGASPGREANVDPMSIRK